MLESMIVGALTAAIALGFKALLNAIFGKKKDEEEEAPAVEEPKPQAPVQRADPNIWTCRYCGTQNRVGNPKCSNCRKG